ncbi:MAG TPA: hypothetical protein VNM69_00515 [Bacillus sp. (in: firmicutes)]|uniref:hypothetical protein n=1 Tax=Bacillus litorisediminis TaxID=2922713 RepID=UPI001FB00F21|nr:hypothetical protein [Bacillus litorisediminis]HWO74378.1 hypothetical protein [Bacillus sp. (in: firmicutes)]
MERKIVLNIRVADELLRRGHTVISVKPSTKVKGRAAFVFKVTPEFERDLTELSKRK